MSFIASDVSAVMAEGSIATKVLPRASKVETPSVVSSRYGVSSWGSGKMGLKSKLGMASIYRAAPGG